ncbi:hypothetical protein JCM11491_006523 [Sporobolomyces phaffii]
MSDREPCCGVPLKHWASIASVASGVYLLGLAIAAFGAFSYVSNQRHVTTEEGNEPTIWSSPRWTALGESLASSSCVGIATGILACMVGYVAYLVTYRAGVHRRRLEVTWIAIMVGTGVVATGAVVGQVKSFAGATERAIEDACKTIDTDCFDNYRKLAWYSIIAEVVGVVVVAWMLVAVGSFRSSIVGASAAAGDVEAGAEDKTGLLAGPTAQKSLARSKRDERRQTRTVTREAQSLARSSKSKGKGKSKSKSRSRSRASSSSSSSESEGDGRRRRRSSSSRR